MPAVRADLFPHHRGHEAHEVFDLRACETILCCGTTGRLGEGTAAMWYRIFHPSKLTHLYIKSTQCLMHRSATLKGWVPPSSKFHRFRIELWPEIGHIWLNCPRSRLIISCPWHFQKTFWNLISLETAQDFQPKSKTTPLSETNQAPQVY